MDKVDVKNLINWGQNFDDDVLEIIDVLNKFIDGYYGLCNYGEQIKDIIEKVSGSSFVLDEAENFDKQHKDFLDKLQDSIYGLEKIRTVLIGEHILPHAYQELLENNIFKYGLTRESALRHDVKTLYEYMKNFLKNEKLEDKFFQHMNNEFLQKEYEELDEDGIKHSELRRAFKI